MHFIIDVSGPISMIIIGGILQENPFFTPPEEFLRELRERRAALRGSRRTDAITSASSQAGDEIKRLQSCVNGLNPCSGACGNLDQPGLGAQCGQPAPSIGTYAALELAYARLDPSIEGSPIDAV